VDLSQLPPRENAHRLIRDPYPDVPLEPGRTALLVVDMQYFDAHPDYGLGRRAKERGVFDHFAEYFSEVERMLPRIRALADACRARGIEVLYAVISSLTPDSRDIGLSYRLLDNRVPPDSREAEVLDEIKPRPGEIVLKKSCSGVFNGTAIDQILRNMGIANLIVVGVATPYCVETAVRDASDRGYRVLVVSDCCAAIERGHHEWSLRLIKDIYAQVLPWESVMERVGALAAVGQR
jgi:nicotinamidase-related amidase